MDCGKKEREAERASSSFLSPPSHEARREILLPDVVASPLPLLAWAWARRHAGGKGERGRRIDPMGARAAALSSSSLPTAVESHTCSLFFRFCVFFCECEIVVGTKQRRRKRGIFHSDTAFPVSIRDGRLNRAPMSKIEDFPAPSYVNCKCTSVDCTSVCAAHMYTHSLRRRTLVFIASVRLKPRQIYAYTHTGYHSLRRETPFFVPARVCGLLAERT